MIVLVIRGPDHQNDYIKKVQRCVAVNGTHSYGTSLAIWNHTALPATRHK